MTPRKPVAWWACVALWAGCAATATVPPPAAPPDPVPPADAPVTIELAPPPPLVHELPVPPVTPSRLLTLPVEGYGSATVVTPASEAPAPLTLVLHGSYDRPEWVCEIFRRLAHGKSWVLCIRGVLRPEQPADGPRWTLGKAADSLAELEAAERSLRAVYGRHIAEGPPILAGFSKGAYQAAWLAAADPRRFPRLMLTEGGHSSFPPARMTRFARRGGVAVAWGCGTGGCQAASHRRCQHLKKQGVACHVLTDFEVGHSYNPPFPKIGARLFTWLLTHPPRTP